MQIFSIFIFLFFTHIVQATEDDNVVFNNPLPKSSLKILDKAISKNIKQNKISISYENSDDVINIDYSQPHSDLNITVNNQIQPPDINVGLISAIKAYKTGQIEVATYLYKKILAKYPNNYDALFSLATIYQQNKQRDEARSLYTKLLTHYPEDSSALNNFITLSGEESPIETIEELKKIEKLKPEDSLILAQIAQIYVSINDCANAISYFNKAIIIEPSNIVYRYNLAILYDKFGLKSEALFLYNQVIKENFTIKDDNIHNIIIQRIKYLTNS